MKERLCKQVHLKNLFERPNTTFVGYFIGSPAMNLFDSEATSKNTVKDK